MDENHLRPSIILMMLELISVDVYPIASGRSINNFQRDLISDPSPA